MSTGPPVAVSWLLAGVDIMALEWHHELSHGCVMGTTGHHDEALSFMFRPICSLAGWYQSSFALVLDLQLHSDSCTLSALPR